MERNEGAEDHQFDSCKRKIRQLERRVVKLEGALQDKDAIIASLKAKQRQTTAELVEYQLQELQRSLCEKDSSLAAVELKLQQSSECSAVEKKQIFLRVKTLQAERNLLSRQLKTKVRERFGVLRKDSEEVLRAVAKEYRNYSREQLCGELRSLDLTRVQLKAYIDQLLAIALEANPSVLEGMPRIQQNPGLKLELFSVASLTELLEELHDREENCQHLQHYASLLLQKLAELTPHLDTDLIPKWEELGVAMGCHLKPSVNRTHQSSEREESASPHPEGVGEDFNGTSEFEESQGSGAHMNGRTAPSEWEGQHGVVSSLSESESV